jgi:monoamine oxidase
VSGWRRRTLLAAPWAAALAGCASEPDVPGGFAGIDPAVAHRLREPPAGVPGTVRRVRVAIVGGGIAGLAAARALRQAGVDDVVLLELGDAMGGNSRSGELGGIACPMGAHYLPLPGAPAREVTELLEQLAVRRRVAGRWTWDERHLCHRPQERLFREGAWQEGLLPLQDVGEATLAAYRRFAALVREVGEAARFAVPVQRAGAFDAAWDRQTFGAWLDAHELRDVNLRWYLDYCCRDEYGAPAPVVSAWAGLHYFASRHGFQPPGEEGGEGGAVLTWPEGNGWLVRQLAAPLRDRLQPRRLVRRIAVGKHGVEVDAQDVATGAHERWLANHVVLAVPAFVAARVLEQPPAFVAEAARRLPVAPWVVVNLRLRAPLAPGEGAPRAWDNVLQGSQGLGYVDARHQALDPTPGPTVLSWYHAPGLAARVQLLQAPWTHWRDLAVADLASAHPDLPRKLAAVQVVRHGHGMAVPVPGVRTWMSGLPLLGPRVSFAHADWAGYSVFEEAFTLGHQAGLHAARVT